MHITCDLEGDYYHYFCKYPVEKVFYGHFQLFFLYLGRRLSHKNSKII